LEARVSIDGAQPWSAAGSGEQAETGVVVVHGFTGNPRATRPLGERIAREGYTVEVVLLPGHGTNHRDLGRTRYADWFATVQRTAEHLRRGGCRRIVVVGHSLGGTLAVDLASRRGELVDGVVAINPQIRDREGFLSKIGPLVQHLLPYPPREIAGLPADDIARPGVDEGSYPKISAKAGQSLVAELPRIRAQLPDLKQPLLVASSIRDHSVPPEDSQALLELVGSDRVELLRLARSYHVPMLDYDAERLEDAVVEFVGEVARA
jgi:carboxylesterase